MSMYVSQRYKRALARKLVVSGLGEEISSNEL